MAYGIKSTCTSYMPVLNEVASVFSKRGDYDVNVRRARGGGGGWHSTVYIYVQDTGFFHGEAHAPPAQVSTSRDNARTPLALCCIAAFLAADHHRRCLESDPQLDRIERDGFCRQCIRRLRSDAYDDENWRGFLSNDG
jgi:hypothetical protein